jgi:glutamyl-tRNA reductase
VSIVVADRTCLGAERLAARPGAPVTRLAGLADLTAAMAHADVVICCTGAPASALLGEPGGF